MSPLTVLVRAPDGPVHVAVWPADPPGGAGDAVLFACHGWTDAGEVFGPLFEALGRRWTVVAPDAPGHGSTPLRDGPWRVADHAASAVAVLDALPEVAGSSRPVVALGHSMGALTAARLAVARPAAVAALVLEEPARTTPRRITSSARMKAWVAGLQEGSHENRVDWAHANHPDWPRDELGPWARSKAATDLAHFDRDVDWGEPVYELLAEVRQPSLIVRGEPARGGIVSMTAARRCAAACPGGCEVLALDAGHCPRREAPRAFAAALASVLATASVAAPPPAESRKRRRRR